MTTSDRRICYAFDDYHIHTRYLNCPRSNITMVLFPGGPGFGYDIYLPMAKEFAKHCNVVLFDPRGCGHNDFTEVNHTFSVESYVIEAYLLIKRLELSNIILHGVSFGTCAALRFTLDYPELVSKLLLSTGSPSYRFINVAKKVLARVGTPEQIKICNEILWPGKVTQANVKSFFHELSTLYSYTLDRRSAYVDISGFNPAPLNRTFRNYLFQFDVIRELPQINCPTQILAGRHDWITPPCQAMIMHQQIKDSRLTVFENAGHSLSKDVPEEYFEQIRKFLTDSTS